MPVQTICKECGKKNRLGAIFCAECGTRLDLDETHKVLKQREQSFTFEDFKHYLRVGRSLLSLGMLVFFVLVFVGIFLPVPMGRRSPLDSEEEKELYERFNRLMMEASATHRGPVSEHEFSAPEVSALLNRLFGLHETDSDDVGYALSPEKLSVRLFSSRYVRLTLQSRALKKIRIYSVLTGRFIRRGDEMAFVPTSARVGKVPMPGPLKDIVVARFRPLVRELPQAEVLASSVEDVEVYEGQLVVIPGESE